MSVRDQDKKSLGSGLTEVGNSARHEYGEDHGSSGHFIRPPHLTQEVVGKKRTGQHVVCISVVPKTQDERPDVDVVVPECV
eukprot:1633325-Rhodomonas_salina.3